ncbi:MAG: preprotein translocase subunit SecG [Gammaproteobacteria bacterium]|nr:preprotein translocase subunit SecG [Gammaproteobacteria bacterium]MDH4255667.1 preprotein translocase subunit SecG [Gammaproteobacteria bacterium]MDH5308751.1 preprotein translocase subunit SecG [Gammaproteobacteria bacterium]
MTTIHTVVLSAHTLIALLIIILVLLQRGKGAEAGAAFGAGASGTVFGARGSSSFFSRATAIMATAFFASSLALAYMSSQTGAAPESLIETAPAVEIEATTEALPGDLPEMPAIEELGPADAPAETDAQAEMPSLEPLPEPDSAESSGESPR